MLFRAKMREIMQNKGKIALRDGQAAVTKPVFCFQRAQKTFKIAVYFWSYFTYPKNDQTGHPGRIRTRNVIKSGLFYEIIAKNVYALSIRKSFKSYRGSASQIIYQNIFALMNGERRSTDENAGRTHHGKRRRNRGRVQMRSQHQQEYVK